MRYKIFRGIVYSSKLLSGAVDLDAASSIMGRGGTPYCGDLPYRYASLIDAELRVRPNRTMPL